MSGFSRLSDLYREWKTHIRILEWAAVLTGLLIVGACTTIGLEGGGVLGGLLTFAASLVFSVLVVGFVYWLASRDSPGTLRPTAVQSIRRSVLRALELGSVLLGLAIVGTCSNLGHGEPKMLAVGLVFSLLVVAFVFFPDKFQQRPDANPIRDENREGGIGWT